MPPGCDQGAPVHPGGDGGGGGERQGCSSYLESVLPHGKVGQVLVDSKSFAISRPQTADHVQVSAVDQAPPGRHCQVDNSGTGSLKTKTLSADCLNLGENLA